LQYASYLQNEGIGFFITNNDASKLTTVIPPIKIKGEDKIDLEFVEHLFDKDGLLNKNKKDFERRDGQVQMALKVAESFNKNKLAVIEAGTGIGKSLAYLIPAFLWAEKNNERVVISTNTINLQTQLINKDIPLVKEILNSNLEAVLVKGRRNYLCKLKLNQMQTELEFEEESEELNTIIKWASTTEKGSIDELNFIPANNVWEKVASEADFCAGSNCAFYQGCHLQKARREASESNILVANHHILFADIQVKNKGRGVEENILLPPYRRIIFDEAHNIEKSASSFFSTTFSKSGFYKFMSLYRGKNGRGFLPRLSSKLAKQGITELSEISGFIADEVLGLFNLLYNNSFEIFDEINNYLKDLKEKHNSESYNSSATYRIRENEWKSEHFIKNFISPLNTLSEQINEFARSMNKLTMRIDELSEKIKNKFDIDFKMVKSYKNKLDVYEENISSLINSNIEENVAWIETFGDVENPLFNFVVAPLYINKLLCDSVYNVFDTVVLTSATLTVDRNFNYFKNCSGLSFVENRETSFNSYDSPFDYKKQVLVVVPTDIPEPNSFAFNDKINDFLKESILTTKGSAFVLFTSYSQLKKSYENVSPYLRDKGYRSFFQGEMEKGKLLEKFKDELDSNLFATDSFWEGVDAPGQTLRYVILTKLPFRMPSEPLEEAKVEDMEKRGLNPFTEYTLPSAVIRFRQGFGRLVRTKNDYGIVSLLDSRVLSKSYGKTFFKSLPECKFFSGGSDETITAMKNHIESLEK